MQIPLRQTLILTYSKYMQLINITQYLHCTQQLHCNNDTFK